MGTYVNNLRLLEITTGDESGTWGTKTNTNLELIADAFGSGTEAITTNADTHTTTVADGAADEGRAIFLKYTGSLDSACTITLAPNTINKLWFIENATTGSQSIIINQGTSGGSGGKVTIGNGNIAVVYTDGAGTANAAVLDAFADLELSTTLTVAGNVDFNGALDVSGTTNLDVVDIDGAVDMATTALVTGVLTTTATQVATGGVTSGSDIISDTDSTDSLGSTGVRWLKGWFDTLTAGTLTIGSGSVTDSSGAITFGNENLTTTGIVTAAGTSVFTNLDISGDVDVNGTTNLDIVDIDGAVDMATTALVTGVLTTTATQVANGGITSNSNVSITVADNSAGLQVICTDADASAGPLILLDRDTASPADGDAIGRIYSQGRNDADQLVTYSQITTKAIDVSDGTEDGQMLFNVIFNGTSTTILDLYGPEIEMNTTLVDMNANLDVSGTSTLTGAVACSDTLAVTGDVNIDSRTLYVDASTDRVAVNSPSDGEMLANFTVTDATDRAPATSGNASGHVILGNTNNYGIALGATSTGQYTWLQAQALDSAGVFRRLCLNPAGGNVGVNMTAPTVALHVTGAITATGAVTGSSKSFKIDHPLDSMKDTHDLFHVSVESPRADLQYRGVVTLSSGAASVDLDESVGMTDGTWEALCRDPQVFLQNDTGWSAVRGAVSGSTLIVTCKDTTSSDTISWMVVAERDDPTYHASTITDDDGLFIIEAEKPEDVEDGS